MAVMDTTAPLGVPCAAYLKTWDKSDETMANAMARSLSSPFQFGVTFLVLMDGRYHVYASSHPQASEMDSIPAVLLSLPMGSYNVLAKFVHERQEPVMSRRKALE